MAQWKTVAPEDVSWGKIEGGALVPVLRRADDRYFLPSLSRLKMIYAARGEALFASPGEVAAEPPMDASSPPMPAVPLAVYTAILHARTKQASAAGAPKRVAATAPEPLAKRRSAPTAAEMMPPPPPPQLQAPPQPQPTQPAKSTAAGCQYQIANDGIPGAVYGYLRTPEAAGPEYREMLESLRSGARILRAAPFERALRSGDAAWIHWACIQFWITALQPVETAYDFEPDNVFYAMMANPTAMLRKETARTGIASPFPAGVVLDLSEPHINYLMKQQAADPVKFAQSVELVKTSLSDVPDALAAICARFPHGQSEEDAIQQLRDAVTSSLLDALHL
ncbi:MAG: hypothetical protein M0R22_10025 [Dehalococcoidia bacterium]|nr:hypothetical protein [Dehalococcoidia bacterium]